MNLKKIRKKFLNFSWFDKLKVLNLKIESRWMTHKSVEFNSVKKLNQKDNKDQQMFLITGCE